MNAPERINPATDQQAPAEAPLAEALMMTDDEYYPLIMPRNVRPTIWKRKAMQPKIDVMIADPLKRADRRFLSLVNGDTPKDNPGALPGIFLGIQAFKPGEHILPHRHNSFAIYHIMQGTGYSILDGERIDWEQGDTFVCPAWAMHEHINNGTELAIQYVVQDMPGRAYERNLMWEEPVGHFGHMVQGGFRPHNPELGD
jgi:gentisate 1,2-dioxygenase